VQTQPTHYNRFQPCVSAARFFAFIASTSHVRIHAFTENQPSLLYTMCVLRQRRPFVCVCVWNVDCLKWHWSKNTEYR